MKRFSKIFCVALVVIIFGIINPNWLLINTVSAETKHQTIIKLCETNKNIHTIDIDDLPSGATVADYDGTCYSKIIDLIFNFYNKHFLEAPVPRTYTFSGQNPSIDGVLNLFGICDNVKPVVWAVGCTAYQDQAFRNYIPDNTNFDLGNEYIKAIKAAVESSKPPIVIVDPDVSPDYYPVNSGTCDETKFSLIQPSTWLPTFNCWIIRLISKVVSWGVQLMSALIEPGKFWGKISTNPAVTVGFSASLELVNIVFSVALVVMAIGTILNLKSYKVNDLITKFIIVALLINFTLVIAGSIIDLANYLSLFFLNLTLKSSGGGGMVAAWNGIFSGLTNLTPTNDDIGILLISILINILLLIALVWAFGSIIFSLFKRGFMLIFMLIISPFAVVASLLPGKGAEQWKKWKTAFLKYTFYGVYVSAGLYIGTIMLQSLCLSLQTETLATNSEMGFMSGLMVPIMAAGFLIYIVLLADELAGGSAKAAAEGASKLALGLAGGAALVGAQRLKAAVTTSAPYENVMNTLSSSRLRAVRGLGQAGLATRNNSQSFTEGEGKKIDTDVARRSDAVNRARIATLAGRTDGRSVREVAAAANQLYKTGHMDAATENILHEHAGNLTNPDIERSGWLSRSTRNSYIRDNNAYILAGSRFEHTNQEHGLQITEEEMNNAITLDADGNFSIQDTIDELVRQHPQITTVQRYRPTLEDTLRDYQQDIARTARQIGSSGPALARSLLDPNSTPPPNNGLRGLILAQICTSVHNADRLMDELSRNQNNMDTTTINMVQAVLQAYLHQFQRRYTREQFNQSNYFHA